MKGFCQHAGGLFAPHVDEIFMHEDSGNFNKLLNEYLHGYYHRRIPLHCAFHDKQNSTNIMEGLFFPFSEKNIPMKSKAVKEGKGVEG
jgi:hypothetical protein